MLHDPNAELGPLEPLAETQIAHSQPPAPYGNHSAFIVGEPDTDDLLSDPPSHRHSDIR